MTETLTLTDAGLLSDLIRAVERNAKVSYYQYGSESVENPLIMSMRCFAHDGGGLWFEYSDEEIDEAAEAIHDIADDATEYLQSLAPAGYIFVWDCGELSLTLEDADEF